ncbi:hypothetical protein M3Y97_01045900 [Aphelenchoides bicaudatus]|nr:hypothetical protein M3Y97_01045900 [Aphelenchoides bicaudatus]
MPVLQKKTCTQGNTQNMNVVYTKKLALRTEAASQKKRNTSGEKSGDAKKSDNETVSAETETNASESETSELENRASAEPDFVALCVTEETTITQIQQPPAESIPLPTFMGLRKATPPSPPASQPNKFTTCEEFERMLIMESNSQTPSTTTTTNQCNGNSHTNDINFDDDLGFDPFSESIKGLADLVMEEQECRKQLQQQQQVPSFSLPFRPQPLRQQQTVQPIQRPIMEPARLYNSYLHQNTYSRYNQFRELAKQALNPSSNWPVGPPPGLNLGLAPTAPINNGFFSQN